MSISLIIPLVFCHVSRVKADEYYPRQNVINTSVSTTRHGSLIKYCRNLNNFLQTIFIPWDLQKKNKTKNYSQNFPHHNSD